MTVYTLVCTTCHAGLVSSLKARECDKGHIMRMPITRRQLRGLGLR